MAAIVAVTCCVLVPIVIVVMVGLISLFRDTTRADSQSDGRIWASILRA